MEILVTAYLLLLSPEGRIIDCRGIAMGGRRTLIGITEEEAHAAGYHWIPAAEIPDPGGRILGDPGHRCSCGRWVPCPRDAQ